MKKRFISSPGLWKLLYAQAVLISSVAIPLLLWVWSRRAGSPILLRLAPVSVPWQELAKALTTGTIGSFAPAFPQQFSYLALAYWPHALIGCSALVAVWLWSRLNTTLIRVYGLASLALLSNALILAVFFTFPSVASYESSTYAGRLLVLALWCLLPFLLISALWLYRLPLLSHRLISVVLICGLAWGNTAAVYASYPRHNRFERSRQFSTSSADFAAVHYIDGQMKSDYVVLANQSVSAAAIAAFGFRTYFPPKQGDTPIFYYPVPTASPLYDIYLRMVNVGPTRDNAQQAHDLTGAGTVYFVLNGYWDNADLLRKRARMEADASQDIANGQLTIFTYRFSDNGPQPYKANN